MLETEETLLTDSASKFEALLHQFIKLYDRLTLEHSLMTERELKLTKILTEFKDNVLKLNSAVTTMNGITVELTRIDLKLSSVIERNISVAIEKTKDDLLKFNQNTVERSLGHYIQSCSDKIKDATYSVHELINEKENSDSRFVLVALITFILIGLLCGLFIVPYIFK